MNIYISRSGSYSYCHTNRFIFETQIGSSSSMVLLVVIIGGDDCVGDWELQVFVLILQSTWEMDIINERKLSFEQEQFNSTVSML